MYNYYDHSEKGDDSFNNNAVYWIINTFTRSKHKSFITDDPLLCVV